jgi:hypothetical protein
MEIQTYKKEEYAGAPIYYRNFKFHWEYLTIIKKEIYTAHIEVRPKFLDRLLFTLGINEKRFSEKEEINILKYLRKMAETTVEMKLKK